MDIIYSFPPFFQVIVRHFARDLKEGKKIWHVAKKPLRRKPVSMRKFIYWGEDSPSKDGKCLVNIHLLVGHNQVTITDFQAMATELRKTFPEAKDSEIGCGTISQSSLVNGFSIITWQTYLPKGSNYGGWLSVTGRKMEYRW